MSKEKLPPRSITLKIEKEEYTVKFPTNREFIDIELEKDRLAGGNYRALAIRPDNSGYLAKVYVDCIATFSVLVPDLIKDLNVKSYMDLDLIDQRALASVYMEQFYPWYSQWLTILYNPSDSIEDEGGDSKVD